MILYSKPDYICSDVADSDALFSEPYMFASGKNVLPDDLFAMFLEDDRITLKDVFSDDELSLISLLEQKLSAIKSSKDSVTITHDELSNFRFLKDASVYTDFLKAMGWGESVWFNYRRQRFDEQLSCKKHLAQCDRSLFLMNVLGENLSPDDVALYTHLYDSIASKRSDLVDKALNKPRQNTPNTPKPRFFAVPLLVKAIPLLIAALAACLFFFFI